MNLLQLIVGVVAIFVVVTDAAAQDAIAGREAIMAAAEAGGGRVRVIASLRVGTGDAALAGGELVAARSALVERMSAIGVELIAPIADLDLVVLEVDTAQLEQLLASGQIDPATIQEDTIEAVHLSESVPIVNASQVWDAGLDGSGQTIAIVDTGVDRDHAFFGERVVDEACFSSNSPLHSATTLCPDEVTTQTGVGAAVPCALADCEHGTHVAGIAAGGMAGEVDFSGVAPEAYIAAVQVFSRFEGGTCAQYSKSSPCALSFKSDQIRALEHISQLNQTIPIAAVNMSLGGGNHTIACGNDSRKPLIDELRAVGIPTVISAGNDALIGAVGAPACIETAITVGSTTKNDTVSSFSNSAEMIDLLATGSGINSSVPGGGFNTLSGTSMSAPHVAGAFALFRSAAAAKNADEIETALVETGVSIIDNRNNLEKPRIDLEAAYDSLFP